MYAVSHSGHLTQRILHLRLAQQEHVSLWLVVIERISPELLLLAQSVYLVCKEVRLQPAVVPAFAGGEHVVSPPEAYIAREDRLLLLRLVKKHARTHEYGV